MPTSRCAIGSSGAASSLCATPFHDPRSCASVAMRRCPTRPPPPRWRSGAHQPRQSRGHYLCTDPAALCDADPERAPIVETVALRRL
jgi:hypothetical protein